MTDDTSKPRVLMVDDSSVMRRAAIKMLSGEFDVVVAEDGEQGWQRIQSDDSLQVVFTDLNMPVLNGYQLIERVRACEDPVISHLPMIVVTGAENDDEAREQALARGATDFITKPFNSTEIRARAQAHADYRSRTRELEQRAVRDEATGLSNQQGFIEALERDLAFCQRHAKPMSVLVLELDGFRELFLKVGRKAGETVIRHVAELLKKSVRREDCVARLGLVRFALSLPTARAEAVEMLAARMHQRLRNAGFRLQGEELRINARIGVVVPALDTLPLPEAVLRMALEALAEAQAGQESVVIRNQLAGAQPLSVDAALERLQTGDYDALVPSLPQLARQLAPLLALMRQQGVQTE